MSAIRHDRRGSRAALASPYSRPTKKSSWNFSSLFSFLNPLRFRAWDGESESGESSAGLPISSSEVEDVNQVLGGHNSSDQNDTAMQPDLYRSQRPQDPPRDRRLRPPMDGETAQNQFITAALGLDDTDDASPTRNIEIVTKFLEERGGKPMSSVELEGVISLLRKSSQPEKHEPFRFSFSTSPTPGRSDSPDTVGENATSNHGTTQAPPKMLTKNPNGVYRWRGGGSARPARSRNRYASPAFGPSRSTPDRLVLKDSTATGEGSRTDNKRRRIDEDVIGPSPSLSAKTAVSANGSTDVSNMGSVSARSANGIGTQPKVNGLPNGSAPFRLRTPGLQKPTTPAVPSPLRQAWSGSASDVSTSPAPTPPTPPKPTKAANLMAELIKEVTPPKKPDVSNPYQTASPVKITPVSRPRPKRARPTPRQPQPEAARVETEAASKGDETKVDKVTPQAIIEATLPKGSKRARPPGHFEKASLPESTASSEQATEDKRRPGSELAMKETWMEASYTTEEVDEDEEVRSKVAKKPKPYLNGRGGAPSARRLVRDDTVVEEVQDIVMGDTGEKPLSKAIPPSIDSTSPSVSTKSVFGHKPSSIPKEPSKLRFSYQPENAVASPPAAVEPVVTISDSKPQGSPAQQVEVGPKATALALATNSLPTFTFTFAPSPAASLSSGEQLAREQVISKAGSSLPTFTFSSKPMSVPSAGTLVPVPAKTFNWSAAGISPPPGNPSGGSWTCSTCMLTNPASATEKCTICEAPASTVAPTPVKAFDWSAAGIKPPQASASWTCSTCMLTNSASATEKCTICESPR